MLIRPIFYTGQSIGSILIHTNLRKLSDLSLDSICKVCNSKICECSIPNVIYQLTRFNRIPKGSNDIICK